MVCVERGDIIAGHGGSGCTWILGLTSCCMMVDGDEEDMFVGLDDSFLMTTLMEESESYDGAEGE